MAKDQGLDLVQITEKAVPPVCKITDYGKHLYWEKKKEKEKKSKVTHNEMKGVRLKFGMSPHDMEFRAKSAIKFLEKGHKVKIELILRGRQKADNLTEFAKERVDLFLKMIQEKIPLKIEKDIKKEGRGLTMIITRSEEKQ
jgi:translation initiation factor IF-3